MTQMRPWSPLDVFRPVLQALRAESERYFGIRGATLEPLHYDDRRFSELLRVRVRAGGAPFHVFIKRRRAPAGSHQEQAALERRVADEFSTVLRAHAHYAAHPGLSAVRPIACFPEHLTVVTAEAPGETLLRLLERRGAWRPDRPTLRHLCEVMGRVGRWLRLFQQIDRPDRRLSLERTREYIDVRLRMLVTSGSLAEPQRHEILRVVDELGGAVPGEQGDEVLIHADLALGNVLVDGTDVTVIDFGAPQHDAVYHDLAHVFVQLELLAAKPRFRQAVISRLGAALLEGFDDAVEPAQPLFRLQCLKHVVCHYATLATRPAPPAERVYNWYLQRRHQRWLRALIARGRTRRGRPAPQTIVDRPAACS